MLSLTYISTAAWPLNEKDLDALLFECRTNNSKLNITGMLLHVPKGFIQTIEGPEKEVHTLIHKISQDKRHKNLSIVLESQLQEREFPDWTMGFEKVSKNLEPDGYDQTLVDLESAMRLSKIPHRMIELHRTFVKLFI